MEPHSSIFDLKFKWCLILLEKEPRVSKTPAPWCPFRASNQQTLLACAFVLPSRCPPLAYHLHLYPNQILFFTMSSAPNPDWLLSLEWNVQYGLSDPISPLQRCNDNPLLHHLYTSHLPQYLTSRVPLLHYFLHPRHRQCPYSRQPLAPQNWLPFAGYPPSAKPPFWPWVLTS